VGLRAGLDLWEKKSPMFLQRIEPKPSSPPLYRLTSADTRGVKTSSVFLDVTPCSLVKVGQHCRFSCLAYSCTANREAIYFSETSADPSLSHLQGPQTEDV
jgi:hypothetical protein